MLSMVYFHCKTIRMPQVSSPQILRKATAKSVILGRKNQKKSCEILEGLIYLSAFIVPSKTCKLPIPNALMQPIPSEMLAFELNADNTLEGLPPL